MSPDRNGMELVSHACVLLFIISGLCPGISATKPRIIPAQDWKFIEDGSFQIQEGDELRIQCQGEGKLQFSTQKITGNIEQSHHKILIDPATGTYTFIRPHTIPEDSGWYACAEEGIEITNDEQTIEHPSEDISWIYIYVNSTSSFAVMHAIDLPELEAIAGRKAVIPCRPTSPGLKVVLFKNFVAEPVGQNLIYDPKIGFIMEHVDGADDQSTFECGVEDIDLEAKPYYTLVLKTGDYLANTDLKTDSWLRIARGENLTLHCSITVMIGTIAALDWRPPNSGAINRSILTRSTFIAGDKITRKLDLTIMDAVEDDAGEYTCVATGVLDTARSSTNVTILDPNEFP